MSTTPTLLLVDGSSYLYRAYHALPPLTNSAGVPTGAVFGVLNMLKKSLREIAPDFVAVVFDPRGNTARHDIYPDYKANRDSMPDELSQQVPPLHTFIEAMGLPLLMVPGQEADDVIGALAKQAEAEGIHTIISTGDKDFAQLVNDKITLVNSMTNTRLDIAGVEEKFGVPPQRIVDYLALMGDSSDNIPGVPKVGPKTACKWLNTYGSLDALLAKAHEVPGKVGENLREAIPHLPLYVQLVTIKTDLSLPCTVHDLRQKDPDFITQRRLMKELEFTNWLKRLETEQPQVPAEEGDANSSIGQTVKLPQYHCVMTLEDWQQWLQRLQASSCFALDTEATELNTLHARCVGLSFSVDGDEAIYVPIAHAYDGVPAQCPRDQVLRDVQDLLSDPKRTIVGHNLKYDIGVLANEGVIVKTALIDTMLMAYVLDSSLNRYRLDHLVETHLRHTMIAYDSVVGEGKGALNFSQVALEEATPYAAEDAAMTWRLYRHFAHKLEAVPLCTKVLHDIEYPLVFVLSAVERQGVLIDSARLLAQSATLGEGVAQCEQQAHRLVGHEFNLGSPKQLQEILYQQMQLPVHVKTPKGQPSTSEEALQALQADHELAGVILTFRSLSKLKSTYTDKLPQQVDDKTGRVHCSYNQAVTATGRLSSAHPNLQNIPTRTAEGRLIREAFVAPEGWKIMAADYSQIELRIMAHLSQDPGLLKAFAAEQDVHKATAAEVFGVALADVTAEQRRRAKAINFGLMYGMSAFGLAKQLQIGRREAQDYIDCYFEKYPAVHQFMERIRMNAAESGYVETLYGRRLYLPGIHDRNTARKRAAERAAINAPMQGSAADMIKLAMIAVDEFIQDSAVQAHMIMQVHDELVFEVAAQDVDALTLGVRSCMEGVMILDVPMRVDIGVADNWAQAHS